MKEIKATHLRNWTKASHPNCRFYPGDKAKPYNSNTKTSKRYINKTGVVVAVSCAPDGRIRGLSRSGRHRYFTRYYLKFPNSNEIYSYESCYLN